MGSYNGLFSVDVIGNELAIDQFSVTVRQDGTHVGFIDANDNIFYTVDDEEFEVVNVGGEEIDLKGYMSEVPYGTPVWWYIGGNFYAKGYLKSVDRVAKYNFKLTCVSGVGLLESTMHTGGIYQSTPISTVLASIIGGAFPYTVSVDVAATTVSGRLPYDTRRNNLHRLLFATGAALIKDNNTNDYDIEYLNTTVVNVPSSRIALQGSVQRQLPSTKAEVTEHQFFYLSTANRETLFDNSTEAAAVNLLVVFDGAVYLDSNTSPSDPNFDGLKTTGTLTISSSGENFAIVSGNGTLTGKYYVHTTNVMALENNPNNAPERVRRVTECELVTAVNSYNVARRVLSYFQSSKTVKARIIMENERCGQLLQFYDAFGDLTKGYLAKADTLVTSVIGAQCELIDGYVPGNSGNNYLYRQEITQSGTWTVPAGVTRIRLVLIGGGQGGSGGYDGDAGFGGDEDHGGNLHLFRVYDDGRIRGFGYEYASGNQSVAHGGNAGNAGTQGKTLIVDVTVTPGETLSFAIGVGGTGGNSGGSSGTDGTDTSVSSTSITTSSASGTVLAGYVDPMTGDAYAISGEAGHVGGDGGQTDAESLFAYNGKSGLPGIGVGNYNGGVGGAGVDAVPVSWWEWRARASGGGGGGAAFGASGDVGTAGRYEIPMPGYYSLELYPGDGGNGADATAPDKPSYGCGGGGGNGGGGGGNGGGCRADWSSAGVPSEYTPSINAGNAGSGGLGSAGGDGGDGIAIIYW